MEPGYRFTTSGARDPARHHDVVLVQLQRRGSLPRRPLARHRRQSVHHLLHRGDGKRHARIQMDRRQRVFRRRRLPPSRSNERLAPSPRLGLPRVAVAVALCCQRVAARPKFRSTSAAPAMPSWAARRAPCRTTTPPIRRTLWVLDGEVLWNHKAGAAGRKSCADCHGDANDQHEGRRSALSGLQPGARRPIDLEQRINICRTEHQQATPLAVRK